MDQNRWNFAYFFHPGNLFWLSLFKKMCSQFTNRSRERTHSWFFQVLWPISGGFGSYCTGICCNYELSLQIEVPGGSLQYARVWVCAVLSGCVLVAMSSLRVRLFKYSTPYFLSGHGISRFIRPTLCQVRIFILLSVRKMNKIRSINPLKLTFHSLFVFLRQIQCSS